MNHWGQLEIDGVLGEASTAESPVLVVMIHRERMRVLRGALSTSADELARDWLQQGRPVREFTARGWRTYLETEQEDTPLVSGKLPRCARCTPEVDGRVGRSQPRITWALKELPAAEQRDLAAPLKGDPQFAWGVRAREIYAETAGWTRGAIRAGLAE